MRATKQPIRLSTSISSIISVNQGIKHVAMVRPHRARKTSTLSTYQCSWPLSMIIGTTEIAETVGGFHGDLQFFTKNWWSKQWRDRWVWANGTCMDGTIFVYFKACNSIHSHSGKPCTRFSYDSMAVLLLFHDRDSRNWMTTSPNPFSVVLTIMI